MSKLICPKCKTSVDNMESTNIINLHVWNELLWCIAEFKMKARQKAKETLKCSCGKLLSYYEMEEVCL